MKVKVLFDTKFMLMSAVSLRSDAEEEYDDDDMLMMMNWNGFLAVFTFQYVYDSFYAMLLW